MKQKKVPVVLLTGYLGAGKTTVMNHLLQKIKDQRFALIINDMGSINVDADLLKKNSVRQMDESMIEMQNGCICCTLKDEFMEQVARLSKEDRYDVIMVEASGISNPASISESFLSYQTENPNALFYLSSIITVVDANRIWTEFIEELEQGNEEITRADSNVTFEEENSTKVAFCLNAEDVQENENVDEADEDDGILYLVMDQIEFCNVVLLNKCDLRSKEEIRRIKEVIRQLQSEAEIIEIVNGAIDPSLLLKNDLFDYDKVNLSSEIQRALARERKYENGTPDFGVTSFLFEEKRPFIYGKFMEFLEQDYPKEIIRAKGFVWFEDEPIHAQLFEQVGLNASVSEMSSWVAAMDETEQQEIFQAYPEVQNDWDQIYGDRMNQIVFIGRNYDKQALMNRLNACIAGN